MSTTITSPIQAGDTLTGQFIGDSELKITVKVISRAKSIATVQLRENEIVKRKVYNYNGEEYIFPYGKYSMAPTVSK